METQAARNVEFGYVNVAAFGSAKQELAHKRATVMALVEEDIQFAYIDDRGGSGAILIYTNELLHDRVPHNIAKCFTLESANTVTGRAVLELL
jgi:hypothetical protein